MNSPTLLDSQGPLLVVAPNIGAIVEGDGLLMDLKAAEGLIEYARLWPGRVRCLCREGNKKDITYSRWFHRDDLPFEVVMLDQNADGSDLAKNAQDADIITAGADLHLDLDLVEAVRPVPAVMIIEYTLKTRLQINRVSNANMFRRLRTLFWLILTERKRRRILSRAAGIQANGWPAFIAYGQTNASAVLYYDTRLRTLDIIRPEEAAAKAASLLARQPLRLAFSGRLERMKGADHLVAVAKRLQASGCAFNLDIYGEGSLRSSIETDIAAAGLQGVVRIRGPVSFKDVLVPRMKSSVDLFVCCHPQGDPSCTYLETMGCGVPIAGYQNEAWKGLLKAETKCGIGVRIGDDAALAREIQRLDIDRAELGRLTIGAAKFARSHSFEDVYAGRINHLLAVVSAHGEPDHSLGPR